MTGTNDTATPANAPVADAAAGNWVDRYAPASLRPYLRLARADRPAGAWLLLWPCWWSAALAGHGAITGGAASQSAGAGLPDPWHLALFAVGAFVMRGAGCTWNDILDRDIDAQVERTRSRPLPSGQVSTKAAAVFMGLLLLAGLAVLLQFNRFTIALGVLSLLPVAIYPLMKRITQWPQAVLGLTFGWGALMGWAARFGTLEAPALVLYAAVIAWIVGYDTIYAHQDKEDDALIGLGSTALRFGDATPLWLTGFYGAAWVGLFAACFMAGAGLVAYTALSMVALHFSWQITTLDTRDPANCLARFKSNSLVGLIVFAGLVLDGAVRAGAGL
jgi:4-hydroxybenzoate polyprenyltransferase